VKPCRPTLEVGQEADHLGQLGITTRGENVQPLQSVKLIYQPCSRSRAAWTSLRLVDLGGWLVSLGNKGMDVSDGAWMVSKCGGWFGSLRR